MATEHPAIAGDLRTGVVVRISPFGLIITESGEKFFITSKSGKKPPLYVGSEVTFTVASDDAQRAVGILPTGFAVYVEIRSGANGTQAYRLHERRRIGAMKPWNGQYMWDRSKR